MVEDRNLVPDPMNAPIILEIFKKYADGFTSREIANELNERGIKTRSGNTFKPYSLQSILRNRRYIGEYRYKDVVISDAFSPIVTKDLFEKVQNRIDSNKRRPSASLAPEEYILTTKLFCGYCGCFMAGESGTSRNNNIYRYYKCSDAKRGRGCKKKAVRKDWIEDLVIEKAYEMINNDVLLEKIAQAAVKQYSSESSVLPVMKAQLKDTQKRLDNILIAIEKGILTDSTKERLDCLEKAKEELEYSILLEQAERPPLTEEAVLFWIKEFRGFDRNNLQHRKKIIDVFVNSVIVYDDRIEIRFNSKDNVKTIEFNKNSLCSSVKAVAPPFYFLPCKK